MKEYIVFGCVSYFDSIDYLQRKKYITTLSCLFLASFYFSIFPLGNMSSGPPHVSLYWYQRVLKVATGLLLRSSVLSTCLPRFRHLFIHLFVRNVTCTLLANYPPRNQQKSLRVTCARTGNPKVNFSWLLQLRHIRALPFHKYVSFSTCKPRSFSFWRNNSKAVCNVLQYWGSAKKNQSRVFTIFITDNSMSSSRRRIKEWKGPYHKVSVHNPALLVRNKQLDCFDAVLLHQHRIFTFSTQSFAP